MPNSRSPASPRPGGCSRAHPDRGRSRQNTGTGMIRGERADLRDGDQANEADPRTGFEPRHRGDGGMPVASIGSTDAQPLMHVLRQLLVLLHRMQSRRIAIQADVADPRRGHQIKCRRECVAGAQDGDAAFAGKLRTAWARAACRSGRWRAAGRG